MEDVFFLYLYILFPIIAYTIIRIARIDILRISIPSLFLLHYIAAAYAGILPLYFEWSDHAIGYGVVDRSLVLKLYFFSSATLILISLGFLVSSKLIGQDILKRDKNRQCNRIKSRSLAIIIGLCVFSILVLLAYLKNLPGIPLFAALRGNPDEAVLLRTTLTTTNAVSFGRIQYYKLFYLGVMSFLSLVLFAEALITKKRSTWGMVFITFLITTFGSMLEGAKGASFGAFLPYVLTYFVVKNKRINVKFILFVFLPLAIILASVMLVYFLGTDSSSYRMLVLAVFDRLTLGNMVPSYHVLDMFRDQDLLLGRSIANPRGIFPYEQYMLDNEVWLRIFPQPPGSDVIYTAPSVFWAELYANFGLFITLSAIPLIGILLNIIQMILDRLPAHPVKPALIVYFSMHFMNLAIKGVSSFMWDYGTALILLISFIILRLDRKRISIHGREVISTVNLETMNAKS